MSLKIVFNLVQQKRKLSKFYFQENMPSHYQDQSDKPGMMRSFFLQYQVFVSCNFETRKMIIRHFQGCEVRWKASDDHKHQINVNICLEMEYVKIVDTFCALKLKLIKTVWETKHIKICSSFLLFEKIKIFKKCQKYALEIFYERYQ